MIQLPQLHESLLIANERLVDRARRRARLFRTGLLTSAAVVSIGGAAAAGLAIWDPPLGHDGGGRPSVSATPLPAEQQALLSVFRRDQTAADRGAVAQRALLAFSKEYRGVRLAAVRSIYADGAGTGIVLIPVADLQARAAPTATARADALCAFASSDERGVVTDGLTCFGSDDVRAGRVSYGLGDLLWALVPDAVSRVVYHGTDGEDHVLPVRRSAVTVRAGAVAPERPEVEWLDADGRTLTPAGGEAMRMSPGRAASAASTSGFHDCGPDDGNVVPTDVPCGPAARRWVPEDGQGVPATAPKAE